MKEPQISKALAKDYRRAAKALLAHTLPPAGRARDMAITAAIVVAQEWLKQAEPGEATDNDTTETWAAEMLIECADKRELF